MAEIDREREEPLVEGKGAESKAEDFLQKNSKILIGVGAVIVMALVGVFFMKQSAAEQEQEAQNAIYRAQYWFEKDSLNLALEGDGDIVTGFLDIAEDYSGTKAGNLANFYIGVIHMQKGNFEEAIDYLNEFSSDDLIIQARAYSLIGDANLELGNTSEAISFYEKAVNEKPNESYTPRYMIKLGLAYRLNDDYASASKIYDDLLKKYPKSRYVTDAKKYKAKATRQAD